MDNNGNHIDTSADSRAYRAFIERTARDTAAGRPRYDLSRSEVRDLADEMGISRDD